MAFALLIVGITLLAAGVRNTQGDLFTLLQGDFTGDQNFIFWFAAILIIGAIGYVKALKPISTAFLVLVILVLFLTKGNPNSSSGGFFGKFVSALQGTQSGTATSVSSTTLSPSSLSSTAQAQMQNIQTQLANNLNASSNNLSQSLNQPIQ